MKFKNRKRDHGVTRTHKHLLIPTKQQRYALEQMLETHRRLYNMALGMRKDAYEKEGKSLTWIDQKHWLTSIRGGDRFLSEVNRNSLDDTLHHLQLAYNAFFRRIKENKDGKTKEAPGFPRFKGRDFFNSFRFVRHGNGFKLDPWESGMRRNRVTIQGIGRIKLWMDRPINGELKTLSIKREGRKWYACFSEYLGEAPSQQKSTGKKVIGVDVGLQRFLTDSEFGIVANPRFFRKSLQERKRLDRAFSRAKKGSNNQRKARAKKQAFDRKIRNRRRYFAHCITKQLVEECEFVAVEDLTIKEMLAKQYNRKKQDDRQRKKDTERARRGRRLSIGDAGWGEFLSALKYKAQSAGVSFVEVPAPYTSQDCSACGFRVPKEISDRVHVCPECGLEMDRDLNAAINILKLGIKQEVSDPINEVRRTIKSAKKKVSDSTKKMDKEGWTGSSGDRDSVHSSVKSFDENWRPIWDAARELEDRLNAIPILEITRDATGGMRSEANVLKEKAMFVKQMSDVIKSDIYDKIQL